MSSLIKIGGKSVKWFLSYERTSKETDKQNLTPLYLSRMLRELHGEKLSKMEEEKRRRMDKFSKVKTGEEERKLKKQKEARKQISRYILTPCFIN